jgi:hypothetical protein
MTILICYAKACICSVVTAYGLFLNSLLHPHTYLLLIIIYYLYTRMYNMLYRYRSCILYYTIIYDINIIYDIIPRALGIVLKYYTKWHALRRRRMHAICRPYLECIKETRATHIMCMFIRRGVHNSTARGCICIWAPVCCIPRRLKYETA